MSATLILCIWSTSWLAGRCDASPLHNCVAAAQELCARGAQRGRVVALLPVAAAGAVAQLLGPGGRELVRGRGELIWSGGEL